MFFYMKPMAPAKFLENWLFSWMPGDERRQAAKNQSLAAFFRRWCVCVPQPPGYKKWVADFWFPLALGLGVEYLGTVHFEDGWLSGRCIVGTAFFVGYKKGLDI